MAIIRFFSPYEITDPSVVSEKIEGYRYTRQIPTGVESRLRFPDCPATVQAGIDPNQDYNFTELKEISKRKVFLNDDISTRYKDILVMSSDDRDTVNKALEFVHGNFDYQEYFSDDTPEIIKGQFNIAFDANTGEDNIGEGYVNFKDKELNNIVGTFSRNSTATRINSSGVLETVNDNMPRIDWSSGKPKLLIEREGENLIDNSEDINSYIVYNNAASLTVDSTNTIFGQHSFRLQDTVTSNPEFFQTAFKYDVIGGNVYTSSVYVTNFSPDVEVLLMTINSSLIYGSYNSAKYSVNSDGDTTLLQGGDSIVKVKKLANNILKISCTEIPENNGNAGMTLRLVKSSTADQMYIGDGTLGVNFFGFQVEQNTNASSYIPTSGTTETRAQETLVFDNLENYFIDNKFSFYSKCQTYDGGKNSYSDYLEARDNQNNRIFRLFAINNDNRLSYFASSGYVIGVNHDFNKSIFYSYDGTNANVVSSIIGDRDEAISQPKIIDEIQISTQDDVFEIEQYILFPTALSIGEAKYITN